jgi:hypothetical protein
MTPTKLAFIQLSCCTENAGVKNKKTITIYADDNNARWLLLNNLNTDPRKIKSHLDIFSY